jgi:hypothetical protein
MTNGGRFLLIGFSQSGTLLEIVYIPDETGNVNVIHAMKCRKEYKIKYLGR